MHQILSSANCQGNSLMRRLQIMAQIYRSLFCLYAIHLCLSLISSFCSRLPFLLSRFYQQQSGLISRVTDTVKSIVPSWLQKYFKNGDAPEGGGAVPGTDQNCQPPPPNGSEEGPPPLDGRDSPEPSTSNTGEGLSYVIKKGNLCPLHE